MSNEYGIIDLKHDMKLYIHRTWATEYEAKLELADLLKHFAADSEWRFRLKVEAHFQIKPFGSRYNPQKRQHESIIKTENNIALECD
jgi:hypothetical protein